MALRTSDPQQAILFWALCCVHSTTRAREFPTGADGRLRAEVEAAHALMDLRNLLRAAEWGIERLPLQHPEIGHLEEFTRRFDGAQNAWDALEHFGEYESRRGRRYAEDPGPRLEFFVTHEPPERVVAHLGPHAFDLAELTNACFQVAARMTAAVDRDLAASTRRG
ncbi:hypothetical protein [Cellulomonas sp. KRMCY2]|uniref:hypothetical protein n=1 Tax=Cellulomonas sp. KRMCY2 TaxID=1304865 RepID=UPI00045E8520|nr:hypothetical protein [Cellulomonas sp. KRMCY2]